MYAGPSRGGTRGGADQFKWDDVKSDKYRENYLGHSVKAPLGRWQKGRDLTWYAKGKKGSSLLSDHERAMLEKVKQQEQEMLLEQIGARPKKPRQTAEEIESTKMREILAKGLVERDEKFDVGRVAGLGCGPSLHHTTMGPQEQIIASNWVDDDSDVKDQSDVKVVKSAAASGSVNLKQALKDERKREKKAAKKALKIAEKQRAADMSGVLPSIPDRAQHRSDYRDHDDSRSSKKSRKPEHRSRQRRHDSPDRSASPKRRRRRHDSPNRA